MTTKCVIEVAIHLTGTGINPDDITRFLGLRPTSTWRAGDSIGRSRLKRKEDGWAFSLPKEETIEFEQALLSLLGALETHRDRIRAAAKQFNLGTELACAIYTGDEAPIMHIGVDVLRRVMAIGADFDIDLILN